MGFPPQAAIECSSLNGQDIQSTDEFRPLADLLLGEDLSIHGEKGQFDLIAEAEGIEVQEQAVVFPYQEETVPGSGVKGTEGDIVLILKPLPDNSEGFLVQVLQVSGLGIAVVESDIDLKDGRRCVIGNELAFQGVVGLGDQGEMIVLRQGAVQLDFVTEFDNGSAFRGRAGRGSSPPARRGA